MADPDWSTNANEAIQITLKHRNRKHDVQFNPAFTYPIFGEEESIFGYQNLKIKLDYAADTLKPACKITWDKQYPQVGDTKADDIDELLADFLPETSKSTSSRDSSQTHFTPPGELVHQYEVEGRKFGIWSTPLAAKEASQIIDNMQIFVTFFIEGGTFLELDDPDWTVDRWTVFFLYAIDIDPTDSSKPTYSLAGYSTTYRLFFFDTDYSSTFTAPSTLTTDTTLTTHLPCRQRISQFIILPPYANASHGSHLYTTMLTTFLATPTIREITIEDPNEAFDDLRDINDLLRLRTSYPSFQTLTINTLTTLAPSRTTLLPTSTLLPPTTLAPIRTLSKLAPRQFDRLVEMQLLSSIPPLHRSPSRITRKDKSANPHDKAYYFWRLLVKQRLYKHNVDALAQLDLEERVEKLEETLGGVERDYERILEKVEARIRRGGAGVVGAGSVIGNGETSFGKSRGGKRKVVDDEDMDEDGEADVEKEVRASKKKGQKRKAAVIEDDEE